jgi:hypothetical protein
VRLIGSILGVLALLAGGFAVYLAKDDRTPPPDSTAERRTQSTLLLQVRGADDEAIANALLAHDPDTQTGAVVLVPPQVLVPVPGAGSVTLGRTLTTGSASTSRNALSDLVGVVVDSGWVLTLPALTALIDDLGGVTVDVDVDVVQGQTVLLNPGERRVEGDSAVAFLTYLAPGEQEQSRLARVQEVLDGLLDVLPATPDELEPVLAALDGSSTTAATTAELAAFLLGLTADDERDQLQYDVLPVVPIDPGEGVTAFRIDTDRVRGLVDRLFADSVAPGAREPGTRVLVLNGVGTPGLGEAVRLKLVPAGFVFVGSRNAPSFGVAATQILIPPATPDAQALGERVANALGVPPTSVATQEFGTVADIVVLVGADFVP